MPGIAGYRQNVVIARERVKGQPCDCDELPIDGIVELWFEDADGIGSGLWVSPWPYDDEARSDVPGRDHGLRCRGALGSVITEKLVCFRPTGVSDQNRPGIDGRNGSAFPQRSEHLLVVRHPVHAAAGQRRHEGAREHFLLMELRAADEWIVRPSRSRIVLSTASMRGAISLSVLVVPRQQPQAVDDVQAGGGDELLDLRLRSAPGDAACADQATRRRSTVWRRPSKSPASDCTVTSLMRGGSSSKLDSPCWRATATPL